MATDMAQERFWKELHQLKVHTIFIRGLLTEAEQKDRLLNIIAAVASSASIGAWVVWKEFAFIWGGVIAFSQVVTIIQPHLPYKNRLKSYVATLRELEILFFDAELKWQDVSSGTMSIQEIDAERNKLQKNISATFERTIPNEVFPINSKVANQAEQESLKYFSRFYPPTEDEEFIELALNSIRH